MGARQKLNAAYFHGSLFLAAVVGGLAQSWPVFFVILAVLLVLNLYAGEIRTTRHGRREGNRR
jgi:hypothetical protein